MFGLVIALLLWLGIAVVGTMVTGLFWLTPVAIAGILGTGAVAVSLLTTRPVPDTRTAVRHAVAWPGSGVRREEPTAGERGTKCSALVGLRRLS